MNIDRIIKQLEGRLQSIDGILIELDGYIAKEYILKIKHPDSGFVKFCSISKPLDNVNINKLIVNIKQDFLKHIARKQLELQSEIDKLKKLAYEVKWL